MAEEAYPRRQSLERFSEGKHVQRTLLPREMLVIERRRPLSGAIQGPAVESRAR
jgi:hypothetical protein